MGSPLEARSKTLECSPKVPNPALSVKDNPLKYLCFLYTPGAKTAEGPGQVAEPLVLRLFRTGWNGPGGQDFACSPASSLPPFFLPLASAASALLFCALDSAAPRMSPRLAPESDEP